MGSYFNLAWGQSVYAQLVAYNAYGDSVVSESGNGAVLQTVPDAPTSLQEVASQRGATQIGLQWTESTCPGGCLVLDYQVEVSEDGSTFEQLANEIEVTQYLAGSLTTGTLYTFRVRARNQFGFGAYS
jgi:hypothetical protein